MNIAIFYENFLEGIKKEGLPEKEALAELKNIGLNRVYMSYQTMADRETELTALLDELQLGIEGFYWFYDFGHHPEDKSWKNLIDMAKRTGAGSVLIVPGMVTEEDMPERQRCLDYMVSVLKCAVDYGNSQNIVVTMEDFDGPDAPYCCVDGLKWFLNHVDGLKCGFDTGNFIIDNENELEAVDIFMDKIFAVHLKDRAEKPNRPTDKAKYSRDGHAVYAAPVGSGYIRIKEIIDRLKSSGYEGTWIIELFDYSNMMAGLRQSIEWVMLNG